jgi:hypothetical protein
MRKRSPNESSSSTTKRLTVLVVSPLDEEHSALQAIVGHPTYSTWVLFNGRDLLSAVALLQRYNSTTLALLYVSRSNGPERGSTC